MSEKGLVSLLLRSFHSVENQIDLNWERLCVMFSFPLIGCVSPETVYLTQTHRDHTNSYNRRIRVQHSLKVTKLNVTS